MPSAFSHAFAAYVLGKTTKGENLLKLIFLGAICAAIPDLDAIGFHYGVPYDSLWGHRGITHSISFSLLLAFIVVSVFYKREKPLQRITSLYCSIFFWQHSRILYLTCSPMVVSVSRFLRHSQMSDTSSHFIRFVWHQ
ncbi:MAG: metal-dependent hydrolase [Bacteroidetes bacterium]|nr:metal-dependent hydrolase [Bacteroidota bacterium]